ncbi:MAG: YqcC family protein, partial [Marinospirillum sp.]|uniref:YqcC family protein n=1 Tax=Marinospirillum sp. TaxID=2183934 RepID=UPI001A02E9C9
MADSVARAQLLKKLLVLLEQRLLQTGHWQVEAPPPEAFNSPEPFCVDSMSLQQWLRYVFIPRLQAIIDANASLPDSCAITAQIEMALNCNKKARVMEVTLAIDLLLTEKQLPPLRMLK